MNIFDLFTTQNMVAYWTEKDLNDPKVGDQLFPFKKENGLDVSWVKGSNNQPVGIRLSAWDAKSIRRDREGISKYNAEMPYFKESMVVDEKTRQELLTAMQTNNPAIIKPILVKIFDDNTKLIKACYETTERARMQMLTTGTITLGSNGQSYTYDYGMPADNKQTVATAWSNANADPIQDIIDAQNEAKAKGIKLTRAMCASECLNALLNNTNIKNRLYVLAQGNITITADEIRKYIEQTTGIRIYVNDNGYIDESTGTFTKYFASDVFVLMPEGPLGNTHYGTTPAEADLMAGSKADVSLIDNAIALLNRKEIDPVLLETIVSMVMLPSFDRADAVWVIDTDPSTI